MMVRFSTLTVLLSSLLSSFSFAGIITTEAGSGVVAGNSGDGAAATSATLSTPYDTVLDAAGNLYIADSVNSRIRKVNASDGIISTLVAGINAPRGLAINATDLFVSSFGSNQVLKINLLTKTLSVIAGTATAGFSGDGAAASSAQLNGPTGLALDAVGDLYIADALNNRIRKIALVSGLGEITTVLGDGTTPVLNYPQDVIFAVNGDMLIADSFNNRVQKISGATISTVVGDGTAASSGDSAGAVVGLATLAQVNNPTGLALDASGNVYVSEYDGHRIRKINTAGLISTLAGSGIAGFSGDGGSARLATLRLPTGFVVEAGVLHFADTNNHRIRKIVLDTTPATLTLTIDNNSTHTNQTTLSLGVVCDDGTGSGCDLMRISEDAGATWTSWQSYAATLSWPLLANVDGSKNMAVQLLDAEGNLSEASASIILDTQAPLNAPVIDSPINGSSSKTANNTISGTAEAGGTVEVLLGTTNLGLISADLSGNWGLSHLFTEGQNYSLTAQVTDLAGNIGPTSAATLFNVDLSAPSIALNGGAVTVQADPATGAVYNEQGAVVTDNFDTLTAIIGGTVNVALPGEYILSYDASDAAGNAAPQVTRTVTVVDSVAPVITMTGANIGAHEAGATYTDAGATALDGLDGDISANINAVNSVDITRVGTYSVSYDVSDAAGNAAAQASRSVTVVDTTPPLITLNGGATVQAEAGLAYVDLGATTSDNAAAAVTLTDDANVVNTAVLGTYTVTYTATDGAALSATSTRIVNVTDTTLPIITLTGGTAIQIEATPTDTYADPGFSATDSFDAALPAATVSGAVPDSSVPNIYNVNYDVSDASGNAALQVTRQVTVSDTTAPLISVVVPAGQTTSTVNLLVGDLYSDVGATADDSFDGVVTIISDAAAVVNTAVAGSYSVTYTSTDAAGNVATATRQVNVLSDQPVISLIGATTVSVEAGSTYIDLGATAFDNVDGNISTNISIANSVNTAAIGSYSVTYNVSDAANNAAVAVTRIVNVLDSIAPTLVRNGGDILNLSAGSVYTDAGAVATDAFEGDISASIVVNNPVDTAVPGVYSVVYNVSDASGNAAQSVSRTVVVLDKDKPVIGVAGGVTALTHEAGSAFVVPSATASDAIEGDLSGSIVVTSTVNEQLPGRYVVIYTVQDSTGNSAQTSVTVTVEDSTAPTITLLGNAALSIEFGSTYVDAGATASDIVDGNISANVSVVNGVDTAVLGVQSVEYASVDRAGNTAQLSRTVTVVDTTPPSLTLSSNALSLVKGDNYIQPNIIAVDAVDGMLAPANIAVTGSVDSNQVGVYSITVIATDAVGNASAPQTLVVTVVDSASISGGGGALSWWLMALMLGFRLRKRT
ncbi:MAG: DUF5011 domain-containing protein [Gammaproteobacteria bacterium]|nr:DUF5011 domain-containing protein [Gammaproteobacteria bacterium]